jgi:two-component system, chemotaxis family, CheB/CheR fusion protein
VTGGVNDQNHTFESLLEFLKSSRGFDFTGYKRASLRRRIEKRMQEVKCPSFAEYLDYLEANAGEFQHLFNTILINVTAFFRDPDTWEYLQKDVLPGLADGSGERSSLRVWVPGCASGEEAYTVAMILAEAMDGSQFRERVKIYGTDVDEEALAAARHGSYTEKELEPVPPELRERYFERAEQRFSFRKDLRRSVIFGRNDLVGDAPISRIDLLICRNTLMYFNAETQQGILDHFHFALRDGGVLVLGKSEMLVSSNSAFKPIDLKRRVFRQVPRPNLRQRLTAVAQANDGGEQAPELHVRLRHGAFDQAPVAQLVVDREGAVVLANQQARALFDLRPGDAGRPLKDLSVAYRPIELRPAIDAAFEENGVVDVGAAQWRANSGEELTFQVRVAPLTAPSGPLLGAAITYLDVTGFGHLQAELERSTRQLESAYEELQSTVEELETTNEELQSTNEELETTNEELQSTNEELETTNEELQSTNEELETINDELSLRTTELEQLTAFMESILTSLGRVVVVLDEGQAVQVWNTGAEELWGLRPEEAEGQSFMGLDIGLPVNELGPGIAACLDGKTDRESLRLAAVNRRGKSIECQVTIVALRSSPKKITGAILLMDDVPQAD